MNSFPPSFEERMRVSLGKQWTAIQAAHNQNSSLSIRINPKKIFGSKYKQRIPWTNMGYYLDERPTFTLDPILHGGGYYVQEASSMFLEQAITQATNNN